VIGKREALKKRVQNLEKKVEAYDRLLTEIQPRLDSQDKELIRRTRAQVRQCTICATRKVIDY
jgi:hypothetical protein